MSSLFELYCDRLGWFLELVLEHLWLSGAAILFASAIGLFLGIFITVFRQTAKVVLGFTNIIYTIPCIALLGLLLPISGIGNGTAIIALTIYGLLPIVRNTFTGIDTIDKDILEAAVGMGCTTPQTILRIKLPLALPVILTGFRNAVVMTIALAGIASYIGAGGLGVAIYRGITMNNQTMVVAGSILIALVAIILDAAISLIIHILKRKRRMV